MNKLDDLIMPIADGLNQLDKVKSYDPRGIEVPSRSRSPMIWECEVYSFPQTWGDGSLGFGGISGQAITTAQTVVVVGPTRRDAVVYFGGRFAYHIDEPNRSFFEDISALGMARVAGARKRYSRADTKPQPSNNR